MEEGKQKLFDGYIGWIYRSGKSYDHIGRHIKSVRDFLQSGYPVSRAGYNRYMKDNASRLVEEPQSRNAICELLGLAGAGGARRRKEKEAKPLEKLRDISEKNRRLVNDFIYHLTQEEDYSPHTLRLYLESVKKYFEYANEISVDNYKRFVRTLEEQGMSPATIRLRITAIERLSEFVKKPIKLKRPKFKRKLDTDNVPTEAEYERLTEYLKGSGNKDHYFFVRILATTGARVSEFLQFTWEDILNGETTLRGKGNKYRRFFFNKALRAEAERYVRETGKTGYVAVGKCGRITERGLNQNMKSWGDRCGIDRRKMHPHAFRHFFAKMYLKKNKDIVQLADLLGHGSVDTTRIYLQKSYDEQKRDFNRSVTW